MTRLMVLGLLLQNPMSGYEMQLILQQSQTDTWAGILPGSIYHALKKMTQEELVEVEAVEQTGHRTKAIYRITPKGKEEFYKLLADTLKMSSVTFPGATYTAISFLDMLPKDEIVSALTEQRRIIEKQYADLKCGEELKAQHVPLSEGIKLIFQNMYDHFEIQLRFLTQLEEVFKKQE